MLHCEVDMTLVFSKTRSPLCEILENSKLTKWNGSLGMSPGMSCPGSTDQPNFREVPLPDWLQSIKFFQA